MFETNFQLQRRPFSSIPSPDQYFPATSIEEARQAVVGIVERQQGPALVVGGVGLGKSLLCQVVAESFRHRCRTVIFPSGRLCTRRALLQVILYELGLPYRDQEESELRLGLIDHVTNADLCPNGLLLLVDEADNLTMALLDELRALTNLTRGANAAIRVIMFGGPRLEERFAHPRLESFNQRLAGRFYLEPFTSDETAGYIQQQFAESGGDPDQVFTGGSFRSIHNATEGIPRLVNQLVDHALVMATANGQTEIGPTEVDEAWADLQQLPFPTQRRSDSSTNELPSDIIEFGQLTDEDDETAEEPYGVAETNAESTLDTISDQMDMIDSDSADSAETSDHEVWPAVETEPEVSLYFHEAHDPFGDDFEDEEVVVDHFVSPDAMSQRHRRQVSCADDSADIAEQLSAQFPNIPCEDEHAETSQAWNVIGGVEDQSVELVAEPAADDDGQTPPSIDQDDAEQISNTGLPLVRDAHLHLGLHHDDLHADDLPGEVDVTPADDFAEPAAAEAFNASFTETPADDQTVAANEYHADDVDTPAAEAVDEDPIADAGEVSDQPFAAPEQQPINDVSGAWLQPNADELASQGLHFEEFDLFPTAAEQPAEVEDVSFGPGVPEHAAGEADVDAAVPDEEIADDDFIRDSEPLSGEGESVEAEFASQQDEPAAQNDRFESQVEEQNEGDTPWPSFEPDEAVQGEAVLDEVQRDDANELVDDTPASLSFRDALNPIADTPERAAQSEPEFEPPTTSQTELESDAASTADEIVDEVQEVEVAPAAELEVEPVAAEPDVAASSLHEDPAQPEIVEAEPKTTKAATTPKRGSDYRRLFSQIRSKRR